MDPGQMWWVDPLMFYLTPLMKAHSETPNTHKGHSLPNTLASPHKEQSLC